MSRAADAAQPAIASADQNRLPASSLAILGISVVLLSSGWPITKQAIADGAAPIWFAFGRAFLSFVMATLVLAALRRLRWPGRADWPALVGVGLFQLGGYFGLAHAALAWVAAGRTAILSNTTTIWVVPLSLILLGEHIPARRWLAVACGLMGVLILMSPWSIDWTAWNVVVGHGFLLGAALSWSLAILVVRRFTPRLTMLQLLPGCFALASAILLPLALFSEPGHGIGRAPFAWGALLWIGLIAGPVGTWCAMQAVATLPTVVASVGFLATPAVGLLLSNLLLAEPLTPDLLIGSALIMGSVAVAAWPARVRR